MKYLLTFFLLCATTHAGVLERLEAQKIIVLRDYRLLVEMEPTPEVVYEMQVKMDILRNLNKSIAYYDNSRNPKP